MDLNQQCHYDGRFTVSWGYQFSYISKISIGYLYVDKPLIGRLFIVRHFFVKANVALSGFAITHFVGPVLPPV